MASDPGSGTGDGAVNVQHLVVAMCDVVDTVGVDDIQHGKRVAYIASLIAEAFDDPDLGGDTLFRTALLHDVGVSSTEQHARLIGAFDPEDSHAHCERGALLLSRSRLLAPLAKAIERHHDAWSDLTASGCDRSTALTASCIFLADRIDAVRATLRGYDLQRAEFVRYRIKEAGHLFCPDLVRVFDAVSRAEAFWLGLEPRPLEMWVRQRSTATPGTTVGARELREIAGVFADIVDAKSPYLAGHSRGVAAVAAVLCKKLRLPAARREAVEVAALLHDLGKVRVPDEILDKPGPLDEQERLLLRRHSHDTYQLLRSVDGLENVTRWAAFHHERPNGRGYPFRVSGAALPLEARIIAVADVFQALVEARPHRPAYPVDKALHHVKMSGRAGDLDGDVVSALERALDVISRTVLEPAKKRARATPTTPGGT